MREDVLRRYFTGEVPVSVLATDLQGSATRLDAVRETVAIEDMQVSFRVSRLHVVMLCDAFLQKSINAESLSTVAFGLIASDHFEWDDDVVSEVLHDWSAPEINLSLNDKTINMHRSWLVGAAESAPHRSRVPPGSAPGRLVSLKEARVATTPRKGFRHWTLYSKYKSPAFAKTRRRRESGLCIGCGSNPCKCKNPKRTNPD
jgi:hypothetical protein